ncbi:hypothetical protein, partial [Actibacterium sp.]|uniref:hypothetical protein n=1 Tax=Actibacterium sp. TaxID=1872125 RepID=UPI00356518FE
IKSQYARLKAYFKSDQGRANLSQNGDPAQVRVIRTSMTNGVFIVQARDNSAEMPRGQWRAIFDLGDYVVSATVTALQDQPISDDAGGATLEALIARIVTTKAASE